MNSGAVCAALEPRIRKYVGRAGRQPGWEQTRMLWDHIGWFTLKDNACKLSAVLFYI